MTAEEINLFGSIALIYVSVVYFVVTVLSKDKKLPLSVMLSIITISVIKLIAMVMQNQQ